MTGDAETGALKALAQALVQEGRAKDALTVLEHLATIAPDAQALSLLVRVLGDEGRTLDALHRLLALKPLMEDAEALLAEIRLQMPAAFEAFNRHAGAGEVEAAETFAAALAALAPGNVDLLNAALSCNTALGRKEQAAQYAAQILVVDPSHAAALAALAPADVHPLVRLRDLHDAASRILCAAPSADGHRQAEELLRTARVLAFDAPAGSDLEGWTKHYRLAVDAIDLAFMAGETPAPLPQAPVIAATGSGRTMAWPEVQRLARETGARTVFFAAADETYVDLYARWYVKSVLKHADVPCLVIVQVIGGAKRLEAIARSLAIADGRFILAGDEFDAGAVTTRCYDTPPKGLIAKPVAHLQSARFLRLGALLDEFRLPVFVSDIDLLLQRGVADLLERHAGDDVVLNENEVSWNAGSRFTANLLLVSSTPNAKLFAQFLAGYLSRALAKPEVSRWIDQFGLLMARHHLAMRAAAPRIGTFDTKSDINNVMYRAFQENPFRFLSLYHGFDTSTLEAA